MICDEGKEKNKVNIEAASNGCESGHTCKCNGKCTVCKCKLDKQPVSADG